MPCQLSQFWALQAAGGQQGPLSLRACRAPSTLKGPKVLAWSHPTPTHPSRDSNGRLEGPRAPESQPRELGTPLAALPVPFSLWRGRSLLLLGSVRRSWGGPVAPHVEIYLFSLLK